MLGIDNVNDYYDQNLKIARRDILNSFSNFRFDRIDMTDKRNLEKVFKRFNPNKVDNLAAGTAVRQSVRDLLGYYKTTLTGTLNLL